MVEGIFRALDFTKKGYIDIYDLVREVTINTGEPVKPRDLCLIFKKLSKNSNRATL